MISEVVRIHTDDPNQLVMEVTVTGMVEQIAEIQPNRVFLEGAQGEPLSAEVVIVPNPKYPFGIKGLETQEGRGLKCELKEPCTAGAMRCVIQVENTQSEKGRFNDTIIVQTDNPLNPEIPIRVVRRIQ
ncbi:MAG: hypothetical protein HZB24_14550 [Desulfobacterales bacterium]|nr:hypothetical protein [Desulfobacterales bacterium]